jgi:hypothetical protein
MMRLASKYYFQALEQRRITSDLLDQFLYVLRAGLRSMSLLLQQESPKIFPDQDSPPDLTVLGIEILQDYGNSRFGADTLAQLMKRNIREASVSFSCPDVFFHKKSERDPYFMHPELKVDAEKIHVLLNSEKSPDQKPLRGTLQFIDDPKSLVTGADSNTRFLISDSPIEGIALFIRPHQMGIFSRVHDIDWTTCKLKSLGVHSLVLDRIPQELRTTGRDIKIHFDAGGGVEVS